MSPFRRSTLVICVESDRVVMVPAWDGAATTTDARRLVGVDLRSGDVARALQPLREMLSDPAWKGVEREILLSDRLAFFSVSC